MNYPPLFFPFAGQGKHSCSIDGLQPIRDYVDKSMATMLVEQTKEVLEKSGNGLLVLFMSTSKSSDCFIVTFSIECFCSGFRETER